MTKFGYILELLAPPVISAFSASAAITIGLGQLRSFFGFSRDVTNVSTLHMIVGSLIEFASTVNGLASWCEFPRFSQIHLR